MKYRIIAINKFIPIVMNLGNVIPLDINIFGSISATHIFSRNMSINKIRTPIPINNFFSDFVILKLLATCLCMISCVVKQLKLINFHEPVNIPKEYSQVEKNTAINYTRC